MLKALAQKVINFLESLLNRLFTADRKHYISDKLTQKQKDTIKKLLFLGKYQTQEREIRRVKHLLYNLGFTKRGLEELERFYQQNEDPYLKKLAAWELSLWHLNQFTDEGARQSLELLSEIVQDEKDPVHIRKAGIMASECLKRLGKEAEAKHVLAPMLESTRGEGLHPDLYLAAANLASSGTEKVKWINKALKLNGMSTIKVEPSASSSPYDSIRIDRSPERENLSKSFPLVTVIMPVYNAEDVIRTSLDSILKQTWTNLEVLVTDDCSKDSTAQIVETYAADDSRVRLIKAESNGGAYVARNLALKEATGDFITVNDADDWSHAEKIETQVNHLLKNKNIIGNTSEQARATSDLTFYRRGKPGTYIFSNMSSFMFRRKPVMEAIGFWDSVRFAADSEFIRRIIKVFGEKSIVYLSTGPLSFQRQSDTSLTGNEAFGYHGFKMGARKEYEEAHDHFHQSSKNLKYTFPLKTRPFAVPEPMWPNREEKISGRRHFDVILASDFRLESISNLEELEAQRKKGLRIGLIQMSQYDVDPARTVHFEVRDYLDGDSVQMLVYGEKLSCDSLIIRHVPALQEWQRYIPDVEAEKVIVVVNGIDHLQQCKKYVQEYFADSGTWYPLNALIRKELQDDWSSIKMEKENWIDVRSRGEENIG
ncbi:glycosyltransferase family 2 protein [Natribacillus halophilus]|uniref:Glycosyltransferase involved in cell wall bisynthesis n=1 Tax=Natribacillus halophilus TaxID=549003 RepID=A0A1G8SDF3_9BACI|nr:glycosyltransferase family A protein [Natribacillus halophilus]SDJ27227.1 Glycosyltransferase involved in cell wall bisynthesis [Natribacillus halophilus]